MQCVSGLCGGSASGKTTVARRIIEQLDVPWVSLLSQDSFYKVSSYSWNCNKINVNKHFVYLYAYHPYPANIWIYQVSTLLVNTFLYILTHLAYRDNAKKTWYIKRYSHSFESMRKAHTSWRPFLLQNDVDHGARRCNVVFTLERCYIFM